MSADDATAPVSRHTDGAGEPIDGDWIARMRAGDSEAFGELLRFYRPQLVRAAAVEYPNDAEDLVQEATIRAWRARDKIQSAGLLFTILKNLVADRRRLKELREVRAEHLAKELAFEIDMVEKIHTERRDACLEEAFTDLPAEDRVLIRTKGTGMSFENMATLFQKPDATIRRHVRRIQERIAGFVRRCLDVAAR